MRKVTTYIAFDGTEFDIMEKCVAYENKCRDYCLEFVAAYDFYDKNGQHTEISTDDIEVMRLDILHAYGSSGYARVHRLLDNNVWKFMSQEFYFDLPNELGYFKYDYYSGLPGGWVRWD